MVVTIGGDTYGFWDLGIVGAAGNTEYVAAYKGDTCLFYEEKVQPGSTPFDEDVTCRGSAWAGNVNFKEEVEFGYGTTAERWAGTILEGDTEYGGLPPGTESLVDLQRNPNNQEEVRLLYHRVVAPTKGMLGWAGGDSVAFDLVFTNVDVMVAADVLDLVKVPAICEVMAGEFHDQQARGNTGGGGRERARRALLQRGTRGRIPNSSSPDSRENGYTTGREQSSPAGPRAAAAAVSEERSDDSLVSLPRMTATTSRRRDREVRGARGDASAGRVAVGAVGSRSNSSPGDIGGGGLRRLRGDAAEGEEGGSGDVEGAFGDFDESSSASTPPLDVLAGAVGDVGDAGDAAGKEGSGEGRGEATTRLLLFTSCCGASGLGATDAALDFSSFIGHSSRPI